MKKAHERKKVKALSFQLEDDEEEEEEEDDNDDNDDKEDDDNDDNNKGNSNSNIVYSASLYVKFLNFHS